MKIESSGVPDLELIGPDATEFREALKFLLGGEPDEGLREAARYSVIVRNRAARAIVLLGVRFDMTGAQGKRYSVVHYADTLRNPEKADLTPGSMRFVCAEPLYTALVLGRKANQPEAEKRARMNLENLAKAREIRASLDCVAYDDGRFAGPDSLGAFDRFRAEREAEIAFLREVLNLAEAVGAPVEPLLAREIEVPVLETRKGAARDHALMARRAIAQRLQEALQAGGPAELIARARSHRPRIMLSR